MASLAVGLFSIAAAAFGLGLIFNAAPGPVFAASVRYAVAGGFRPALAVQLGSLAGDAIWAVLGLAGIGALASVTALRVPLAIAGTAYLVWLAWDAWRAASHPIAMATDPADRDHRTALRTGAALSLTNPQNLGYWAALGSALGTIGVTQPTTADYAAFFGGFMLSSLVWSFVFAAILEHTLGRIGANWTKLTYRLCAVSFLVLAIASARAIVLS